ncbi:DNA polymerase IV [Neptunicoccus sediminis]|uniref:DNA polymerase IV n=1 Tax=Neptunicoccus sediminis TaxID=1892596 RepID=UPI000845FCE6|nr:DNA polymerase IV [Neptunicoccus sediminis]
MPKPAFCRDCLKRCALKPRCEHCASPRVLAHEELFSLSIAHMDCDAFYASVEKRDNPEIRDKPVIIGGGKRGVVSTACYIARINGVHSAMPMFKALKLCPEAVVVKPRMDAYVEVSRAIRTMMQDLTPVVEPLSLDEAFIDLSGTEKLHGAPPAVMLARLVKRMEDELGISGSIGLSHNKFLAKLASDLDKPRGFSVVGKAETLDLLAPLPIKKIWGAGPVLQRKLQSDGIQTFADLRRRDRKALGERYGSMGDRLWHLAQGLDHRRISGRDPVKSISKETTFFEDTGDADLLDGHLWRLAEQVSDRAKAKEYAGKTVTLKVKKADFKTLNRSVTLPEPTQMADRIYSHGRQMLDGVIDKAPFRLIGIGISQLTRPEEADHYMDLLEQDAAKRAKAERATDAIRQRFGKDAILKGRALR